MKIYKLVQDKNGGYDTYDSCIVVAEDEEEAKKFHADGTYDYTISDSSWEGWASAEYVKAEYIGEAKENIKKGVILSSFNAG